jgi:hypothetical protein
MGQAIGGYNGHKKTKGSKIHAVVTRASLAVAIDLGPGDEHESRMPYSLFLRPLQFPAPDDQGADQSEFISTKISSIHSLCNDDVPCK